MIGNVRIRLSVTAGREIVLVGFDLLFRHPELAGETVEFPLQGRDLRLEISSTTRFRITTRLRFVLRDFKVYTHRRTIEQRGDRHEIKDRTQTPRLAQATRQWA